MASLSLRRGDTRKWTLAFRNPDGTARSLSGATVWWTVRPSVPADPAADPADAEAPIRAWWAHNGASVTTSGVVGPDGQPGGSFAAANPATGEMQLVLLPRLTTKLAGAPAGGGQYRYDVQIEPASNPDDVQTWDEGTLQVVPDVTRRTTVP